MGLLPCCSDPVDYWRADFIRVYKPALRTHVRVQLMARRLRRMDDNHSERKERNVETGK